VAIPIEINPRAVLAFMWIKPKVKKLRLFIPKLQRRRTSNAFIVTRRAEQISKFFDEFCSDG
jgi:hypothetical protein